MSDPLTHEIRQTIAEKLKASSVRELELYQYELERHYRKLILASRKGPARDELFDLAYLDVFSVLFELRRRSGKDLRQGLGGDAGMADTLASFLGPSPARIFEVGCGTGAVLEALAAKGHAVAGCDLSQEVIDICHVRLPGFTAEIRRASFFDLKQDREFDFIYTNDVLEHVHPDQALDFLKQIHAWLKPGGFLWLITPNRFTGPGDGTLYGNPEATEAEGLHLKEYDFRELLALLTQAGFSEQRSRLWSKGRFRPFESPACTEFAFLKAKLEPVLALLPSRLRRRALLQLKFSEVIARK